MRRRTPSRPGIVVGGAILSEDGIFVIADGGYEVRYIPLSGVEVVVYESQCKLELLLCGQEGSMWVLGEGGLIVVVDMETLTGLAETSLGVTLHHSAAVSKSVLAVSTDDDEGSSLFRVHFEEVLGEPTFTAECIHTWPSLICSLSAVDGGLVIGFTDKSLSLVSLEGAEQRLNWAGKAPARCAVQSGQGAVVVGCSDGSMQSVSQGRCNEFPLVHTTSVIEMFHSTSDQLWSLDDSGKLVSWDLPNQQAKYSIPLTPELTRVTFSTPLVSIHLAGLTRSGQLHEFDLGHTLEDTRSTNSRDSEAFVRSLCHILQGIQTTPTVPTSLSGVDAAVAFLPEALRSLVECRKILVDAFAEFGWSSESLHQDLRRIVAALHNHSRQEVRAEEKAAELIALCPQFALPEASSTDRLLFACDCTLELLADRLSTSQSDEPRSTNYVLESRITQLEQQVERQARELREAKDQMQLSDADVRELTSAIHRTKLQYEKRIEELVTQVRTMEALNSCADLDKPDLDTLPPDLRTFQSAVAGYTLGPKAHGAEIVPKLEAQVSALQGDCNQLELELADMADSERKIRNRYQRLAQRCREGARLLSELAKWVRRQRLPPIQEEPIITRLQFVANECLLQDTVGPTNPTSAVF